MYGLPENIDLSFMVGQELIQVCIGIHQAQLHFDGHTSVYIENDFLCHLPDDSEIICKDALSCGALPIFLGQPITEVSTKTNGELIMNFSKGGQIKLCDSSKEYESYQIKHHDKNVVIV